jgi:hypothetical protein
MPDPEEKIESAVLKLVSDALQNSPAGFLPPIDRSGSTAYAALTRCRDAWLQAYAERMNKKGRESRSVAIFRAERDAAVAFRSAMPQLADYSGIRDFIACIAYGVLIDAIPPERCTQLLYAAQVATSLLPRIPPLPSVF